MGKVVTIWNYLCRHKYMVVTVIFLVIIGFVDENSLIRRAKYKYEIMQLQDEINYYRDIYNKDTERMNELNSNPEAIEKIAREKYLMKTPDEDIFIFENQ